MTDREQAAAVRADAVAAPPGRTAAAQAVGGSAMRVDAGIAGPAVCGACRLAHAPATDTPSVSAWMALGRLLAIAALLLLLTLGILQRLGVSDLLSAAAALSLLGLVGTVARRRERSRRPDDAPTHH